MLQKITCTQCGSPNLQTQPDGRVICENCGTVYAEPRTLCPNCGHVSAPESKFCAKCGDRLTRECTACGHENWAGAEYCLNCGHALDILEVLAQRTKEGLIARLEEQRSLASVLKHEEEVASQKRLEELWEIERKRQADLAAAAARQRARDRATLTAIALGLLFFAACLAAAILVIASAR